MHFYSTILTPKLTEDENNIVRQGYAGLLHTKQFYHYIVEEWTAGDEGCTGINRKTKTRMLETKAGIICKFTVSLSSAFIIRSFLLDTAEMLYRCLINGNIHGLLLGI